MEKLLITLKLYQQYRNEGYNTEDAADRAVKLAFHGATGYPHIHYSINGDPSYMTFGLDGVSYVLMFQLGRIFKEVNIEDDAKN
jgi:hypothetical protein